MVIAGLAVGFPSEYSLAQVAESFLGDLKMSGVGPVAAFVLLLATVVASVGPAALAARVDVIQALRTE
jgi:hypothetical protein